MRTKKKSIILSGYYGNSNLGDDILLKTLFDFFYFKKGINRIGATIKNPQSAPLGIENNLKYHLPPQFSKIKIIRIIQTIFKEISYLKSYDMYIFGGGTRLFETSKRTYQSFLIKYIFLQYNSIFLRKKILHLGVGIGRVETKFSKWLLKRILKLSDVVLLRDRASYEIAIKSIGENPKILLGTDLMFLNDLPNSKKNNPQKVTKIGFSLFQYYGYISDSIEKEKEFLRNILKVLEELLLIPEVEIHLFSFQKSHGGKDEMFNENIINKLNTNRVYHIKYSTNTNSFIHEISKMDLNVGMRYHFCLLSLALKIPVVGINYQPKIHQEFTDLDLLDCCIEMNEIEKISQLVQLILIKEKNLTVAFNRAFLELEGRKEKLEVMMDSTLRQFQV